MPALTQAQRRLARLSDLLEFDAGRALSLSSGNEETSALKDLIELVMAENCDDDHLLEVAQARLPLRCAAVPAARPSPSREINWHDALKLSYDLGINAAYIFDEHLYAQESMMVAAWLGRLVRGERMCLTSEIEQILDCVLPHVPKLPDHAGTALRAGRKAAKPVLVSSADPAHSPYWAAARAQECRS